MAKPKNIQDLWHKNLHPALTSIWQQAIRPLFVTEKRETLFGHRYYKMQATIATLGPVEKDRLSFFVSVAQEQSGTGDYISYIRHIEKFCDLCVRQPESRLAAGLDMKKISLLKTDVDLLVSAIQGSDKIYLDRVRKEMPIPINESMSRRARSAEIAALKEDIKMATPLQPQ